VLAGGAAAMCVIGAAVCVSLGVPRGFLLNYLNGVLLALLGALIAARQPRNSVGWLMIAVPPSPTVRYQTRPPGTSM